MSERKKRSWLMKMRLAISPVTWGVDYADAPSNPPWQKVMDETAEAGYKYTEMGAYGYYPTDPAVLKHEFDKRGLTVTATYLFQPLDLESERPRILDFARKSCELLAGLGGNRYVVIDHVNEERNRTAGRSADARRLDDGEWNVMMDSIRQVSAIARGYGITPVLHQHTATYIEFEDEVDRALADLPNDVIELCIDTGHMAFAGIDPVAMYRKYADRVSFFHFKDIDRDIHARVLRDKLSFWEAVTENIFCPVGQGVVDFVALRQALEEHNFDGSATIEQDMDARKPMNSLEDARASREFLESIGF